ncbi:PQQ-dependent sugar dehydrogenase [Nakamurella aerolata]|uniref:PQQ-dependent sugar dehydrogenase n=1 Tax=Nakamurella aerolata TaxID=1656892 RepID=UPI001BB0DDD6
MSAADAVTGLQVPWGIAVLPDGRALVTERNSGRVLLVSGTGDTGDTAEAGTVEGVDARGEAGLLGVAVSPQFAENRLLAVYFSTESDNRVMTYTLDADNRLTGGRVILDGLPVGSTHDGGRLLWAPDGNLFITVGDAGQADRAQQLDYLGGKILRVKADGSGADGNPFPDNPLVYSYGHRNPQGLTLDSAGRLWEAEFGQNIWDELNLIEPGGNYGWPIVEGPSDDERFVSPQQVWSTADASPSGIAIWRGAIWMASLRGERLWQIPLNGDRTGTPVAHLQGAYGRLRTAVVAPDGNLWVTTSNTDGRGDPRDGDDRILRITDE